MRSRHDARVEYGPGGREWVRLRSNWGGRCVECGEPYEEGDEVLWRRGEGCRHTDCEELF